MPLRKREKDAEQIVNKQVGVYSLIRTGPRPKTITGPISMPVSQSGLVRHVTIDELHEGPPFSQGGPFFSAKLSSPSYAVAGAHVVGRQLPGPTSVTGPFEAGDVWHREYDGGISISTGYTGEPYVSLGAQQNVWDPNVTNSVLNPDDLQDLGNRAWAKLRPKVERASLAQSVIELREAPDMYKTTLRTLAGTLKSIASLRQVGRTLGSELSRAARPRVIGGLNPRLVSGGNAALYLEKDLRNLRKDVRKEFFQAADEYLNLQFGWRPFVKDVNALCEVIVNFDRHVETTTRNNGRWLKREFHEDVVQSNDVLTFQGGFADSRISPILGEDYLVPWTHNFYVTRQRMSRTWYAGSFRYYRPEFDSSLGSADVRLKEVRQALSLLGGNITPTLLYKVTPWTWMVDWFANVGDNVQRIDDELSGGVAARYFYLMREAFDRFVFGANSQDYSGNNIGVEAFREMRVKRRVESSDPFSFSLVPTSFDGFKLAILAALGISSRR